MPRNQSTPPNAASEWNALFRAWMQDDVSHEDLIGYLVATRGTRSPEDNHRLVEFLVRELANAKQNLSEADEAITATQKILEQFGAAPLLTATFLGFETTQGSRFAVVGSGGGRRVVAIAPEVPTDGLQLGDPVYLNADQSVLFAIAPKDSFQSGEVAVFERYTPDGRVVLKGSSGEIQVVRPVWALADVPLQPGDSVRWDRAGQLCLEKMDIAERNPFELETVEDIPLSRIGGMKDNLERLQTALLASLLYPDRARRFKLRTSNTVLLYGPPGLGKTYTTKLVFAEVQRQSGKEVLFCVVNAAAWESPYVGVTQSNISALFHKCKKAAQEDKIVIVFIDEIDAVGKARGNVSTPHSDKALNTLLTEMSGFASMPNVSIIGACNRKDLLDPALIGRFGEEIAFKRPDLQSAREIFGVHLDHDLPYADEETRSRMIEMAVSRLYAPNSAESDVSILKFRSGATRTVASRSLVSGRLIEQISENARRHALARANATEVEEFRLDDMSLALTEAHDRLVEMLTPFNCHSHLESLEHDEVVVAVEPLRRRVAAAPQLYMRLA